MAVRLYSHWSEVAAQDWQWLNFTPDEIACKGTGELLVNARALDTLQEARSLWQRLFRINSAYRSPEHNAAIGGAVGSYHVKGMAFDIALLDYDIDDLVDCLRRAGFTGIGRYNTFVHADIGPWRIWNKRTR